MKPLILARHRSSGRVQHGKRHSCPQLFQWIGSRLRRAFVLSTVVWISTPSSASEVTYYFVDYQGTVLASADAAGGSLGASDYRPYGLQTLGLSQAGPSFTGHLGDTDSGFDYMQARYYDAAIGRFISTDPSSAKAGDVFAANRYAYTNNNPTSNIDPDGRDCMSADGVTRCTTSAYDVSFPTPTNFKDFGSASPGYHFYSTPAQATVPEWYARSYLESNPTPGVSNGASPTGTLNDATPGPLSAMSLSISPVMSYTGTNSRDGLPVVVNVTLPGHPLFPGIVVREAQGTMVGGYSIIQSWGEGTSELQKPGTITGTIINSIWKIEAPQSY